MRFYALDVHWVFFNSDAVFCVAPNAFLYDLIRKCRRYSAFHRTADLQICTNMQTSAFWLIIELQTSISVNVAYVELKRVYFYLAYSIALVSRTRYLVGLEQSRFANRSPRIFHYQRQVMERCFYSCFHTFHIFIYQPGTLLKRRLLA